MAAIGITATACLSFGKACGASMIQSPLGGLRSEKNKNALRNRLSQDQFWTLIILLAISAFFGARLLYVIEIRDYYFADPAAIFRLWRGGFSFFGGAVGAILAGYLWSKFNKIDFWFLSWIFTPAWLFGLFFGRLGCFLIHDHLGKSTTLPWGMWIQGAYRHEPAFYEAVMLLLMGIGLWVWETKNHRKLLFPISLVLYSSGRVFIDFTRADDPLFFGLTVAQWACIIVITASIIRLCLCRQKPRLIFS